MVTSATATPRHTFPTTEPIIRPHSCPPGAVPNLTVSDFAASSRATAGREWLLGTTPRGAQRTNLRYLDSLFHMDMRNKEQQQQGGAHGHSAAAGAGLGAMAAAGKLTTSRVPQQDGPGLGGSLGLIPGMEVRDTHAHFHHDWMPLEFFHRRVICIRR